MTILWCGGEDIDVPSGYSPTVGGSYYDSNFARCNLVAWDQGGILKSNMLPGQYTSAWATARVFCHQIYYTGIRLFGVCLFGNINKGLFVGIDNVSNTKIALWTVNGTTWTKLVASDVSAIQSDIYHKMDMQIESYGSNATIKVYVNGSLLIDFTGDVTVADMSYFNCMGVVGSYGYDISEFILADEDTRLMRLKTLAPSAAGDTNNWSGTYADIDETTLSDTDKLYTSTADADVQVNVTGMPTGSYQPIAVKLTTRFVNSSEQYGLQQGVKTNGSVHLSDTQQSVGYWGSKEVMYQLNPVTGLPWTSADIENLQFAYRHKVIA